MGKIKIDMLSNLLMYKRKCQYLKWEHSILKNHKITLHKYRFDVITAMKVTENMLHYLDFNARGINIAKQAEQKVDKELAGIEIVRYLVLIIHQSIYYIILMKSYEKMYYLLIVFKTYSKEKKELIGRLDELVDRIRSVKRKNEKTDKNIEQMNTYLSDLKKKIDYNLNNKLKSSSNLR